MPRDIFLRYTDPFTLYRSITIRFQALCTSLFGVLFSFRSLYYYAIGLKTYLVLEIDDSQIPARFSDPRYSRTNNSPPVYVYVTITLFGLTFQTSSTSLVCTVYSLPYDTTSPCPYGRDSV